MLSGMDIPEFTRAQARDAIGFCITDLPEGLHPFAKRFVEWQLSQGSDEDVVGLGLLLAAVRRAKPFPEDEHAEKVRENRLRRVAERQGLQLVKSRRRDPRAYDYGTYQLVDPRNNTIVAYKLQSGFGMTLDDIESELDT